MLRHGAIVAGLSAPLAAAQSLSRTCLRRACLGALLGGLGLATAPAPAAAQSSAADGAGSGDVPAFEGLWATDCQAPDRNSGWFVVATGGHVLIGGADYANFTPTETSYLGRSDVTVTRPEDTTLRVVQARNDGDRYDVTLAPCSGLPPLWQTLHGEAVGFLKRIPDLNEACGDGRAACREAVLAELDMAKTGGVNEADLARLVRVAAYVGTASQEDGPAEADALLTARGISEGLGAPIADKIIRGHDYTATGQITRADIEAARTRVLTESTFKEASEQVPAAGEALESGLSQLLGKVLGFGP